MTDNAQRATLLKSILRLDNDFSFSVREMAKLPWDFEGEPVLLHKTMVKDVLTRFVNGELSKEAVYEWADFLEMREDVDFSPDDEGILSEVMHELANPELEGELTLEGASVLASKL